MLNNSRLIQLLSTISAQEHRLLQRFVDSPIYNTNEKVKELLSILKKISSNFTQDIPKTKVYESLFKKKVGKRELAKDESRNLNSIMNRLSKVVEEFIVFQEFNEKKILKKRLLIEGLTQRRLYNIAKSVLNSAMDDLAKETNLQWKRYFDEFLIHESMTHYNLVTKPHQSDIGVQEATNSLRRYSVSGLMRFYCAALSREDIIHKQFEFPLYKYLERYIEENEQDLVPATSIYYYLLKLLRGEANEESFNNLLELLEEKGEFFPNGEQRQIYTMVQNFCILSARAGHFQYREQLFRIYESTLDSDIWYERAYFKKQTFIHIVKNALSIGKLNWAIDFLANYRSKLDKEAEEETIDLAWACIKHAQKDYEAAKEYLFKMTNTQSVAFNLYTRKLEILVAYDSTPKGAHLRKVEALESCINKLRFYLDQNRRRTRIPVSDKILNSYRDFHKLVKRLYRQKYSPDASTVIVTNIREDLEALDLVEERFWLLEKIGEL